MTRIRQVKTNFTAGEVSPELLGRGDLRAYENGALKLRNLFIYPTGGVTRRAGLAYVDLAEGEGRLISFEFNTQQTYLLVLTHLKISLYLDDVEVASLTAPWTLAQIPQVSWTQSADTLLMVHPDVPPKKLTRQPGGSFLLEDWSFLTDDGFNEQPYYKFSHPLNGIVPSATTGSIILTTTIASFVPAHVGTRLRLQGKEVEITGYVSPTQVNASVLVPLVSIVRTVDWEEQVFSPVHGYPISVAFHQDRLVIGGSRDLPNRLWFSRSGDLFNFNLGTGLDDEAIEFAILSDQVNVIRGIFSGRHLQVFTSGAEWMVTGDPLTPTNVQLNRQTRVGSVIDRYIPPVTVDGATLFVARNGREIREFLYTDIEQAYQATDLALLSRHIIHSPVDQDYDPGRRLLFMVRADGKFATLTVYRAEQVAAWTLHETIGEVKSVCVVGDRVYLLVKRGSVFTIELFDEERTLDSSMTGTHPTPTVNWSGLSHLNGQTVSIVADGKIQPSQTVTGGAITLSVPALTVQIGLPFTHVIEPLPLSVSDIGGRKLRMIEAIYRLQDTQALHLDTGQGIKNIPLTPTPANMPLEFFSGDKSVRALGWQAKSMTPLWRIEQSEPLAFTLLAVSTDIKIND
ncbi:MAG: hypothetical protein J0L77_07635 [Alphaproteobacteria bacterium]|nr:hypothetical protein [Alphaproteobacteria bacterium]